MARKPYVAGNWKMNLDHSGAMDLASGLAETIGDLDGVDLAVAPPAVYLASIGQILDGSRIALAAQNMFHEDNGAFTGETSADMLKDVGCTTVILGHSERRHVIGESDERINAKVLKALSSDLDVIFCCGELLTQRKEDRTMEVVGRQVTVGLEGVSAPDASRVTVAYEPVWAIGTGVTATSEQAQEVHGQLRALLSDRFGPGVAEAMRIQYGGSVKPDNAAELLSLPDVDGVLVGGASLKVKDFTAIARAACQG